ncbi:ComF family protein [Stenotrophomonas indicatrix]|uniref:ComF family protein n=1 Tax=Stenotrophomonas indicatrix TaxID=2045451 RepID=UPI00320A5EC4
MEVTVKRITGSWDDGYALDKHMLKSEVIGHNEHGHPIFDSTRTAAGEAVFQLKYRSDHTQAQTLAQALNQYIFPRLDSPRLIIPMPASNVRTHQPVSLVADELGRISGLPVFHKILQKTPNCVSLKNLNTRDEKMEALRGTMTIHDEIDNNGRWNAIIIDDLFHSGASMETATTTLRTYSKINKVFVVAMTWR